MTMDIISVIIVVIALLAIISVPVGLFNIKVFRAIHSTKCTGLSSVKAFTPLYNITFARRLAYGSAKVYNILLVVCLLLLVFRGIALVLVTTLPVLVVYSSLTTIACIALYWLLYIINAVDFCRMFNCGVLTVIACTVIPPIGYYMLSTQVLSYFRSVEDTVSGRFGA